MNELAPGSLSLEEDQTPPEPTPPAETPAAPQQAAPETAQPPADQDPDGTIEGSGGVKFVPLGAVVDLRGKVREKETALAEKDAKIAELQQKAQQFEQIKGDWQRVQPLIQQIQQQQQPKQSAPDPNMVVGEHPTTGKQITLADYTKSLDLWTTGGGLDLERGLEQLGVQRYQAKQQTQQAVQPLYQQTATQQSAVNFERAANFKDKNGVQIDKPTLERVWGLMPPEMSARPEIAGVLYKVAIAEMVQAGLYKTPTQAPPPPLVTESLGGNSAVAKELTALDRQMMTAGQIKTKDYETISANFKPGQTNALE